MRVRLKGVNRVLKRLADGSPVAYYYAWKGGPRLPGKPGSPEFVAAYNEAVATRKAPPEGVILAILRAYQDSPDFRSLAERTRTDYIRQIKKIEVEYGDFPLVALADPRTRGRFMAWRDRLALTSRRQADYAYAVLALVFAWAFDRGLVVVNPCTRGGKVYRAGRADTVWAREDETEFMTKAPAHLKLAFMMALWTGQRQGDLLRLLWSAYDGERITLKQARLAFASGFPSGRR